MFYLSFDDITADPMSRYCSSSFIGFEAITRVFRALDRPSKVSGSKVMAKKIPNILGISQGFKGFP